MSGQEKKGRRTALLVACAVLVFASAVPMLAADPPTIAVTVTGDPIPGGTITAKATVTIKDGSALQSLKWTQTAGVPVVIPDPRVDTITLVLPGRTTFKNHLVEILEEAPLPEANYPSYIPVREFENGLQNRFTVVGASPHATIDAGAIKFDVEVVTSSGTYHLPATIAARLPWKPALGISNVPIGLPVLLNGKSQASYNWTLTAPEGSSAKLLDATTQNPEFTPDVKGTYKLTVQDLTAGTPTTLTIYAGNWMGIVTGKNADGRPTVSSACTSCHAGKIEMFTPWSKTGHAEIFSQNVVDNGPTAHYSTNCLSCHVVGYDTTVANKGFDDAADFEALKASGMIGHGDPENWTKILKEYPASAKLANIQCESCHGPQDTDGHALWGKARTSVSSDVCSTCHGEPARHGRFQQWQLSGHANFETARGEGTNASCTKCHSGQGFIAWAKSGFSSAAIKVAWTADEVEPVSCAVCHDPHAVGTTSGNASTNAPMRIQGKTPMLDAGFVVNDAGKAAICMTCHNGRRGLKNDGLALSDLSRAPHVGPQTDILMGQNLYFTKVGDKGFHAMIADSCISCHMEKTNPPAGLANKNADGSYGGTNHTFFASSSICSKCHSSITPETFQAQIEHKLETLKSEIEKALLATMQAQIRAGNTIDFGTAKAKNVTDIVSVELIESHGRQGVNVTLAGGGKVSDLALNSVKVLRPGGSSAEILVVADPSLGKAGWNYFMIHSDKSEGVHNPAFINSALDVSIFAVKMVTSTTSPNSPLTGTLAKIGGGLGNGAGAVTCTSPYVYWTEIAGHLPGAAGSQWRTDLVARNLSSTNANLRFVLHGGASTVEGPGLINASSQAAFEDIIATLGATNNAGALELCSDQPLLVRSRTYNQSTEGTFGQNFDGQVADVGYVAGQTVSLIGLRQQSNAFRTNIVLTNAGKTAAEALITLFDDNGTSVKSYTVTIAAGMAVIDAEPFALRAGSPDIGWGYATVTFTKGTNVWASASMIDMKTNDPITIPAKQ
jgi:formate-dependent nitrite reductase cytochrome c552 subunit